LGTIAIPFAVSRRYHEPRAWKEAPMRCGKRVEAKTDADSGDRERDHSPPPSTVAARIARQIGETVGRSAADDVQTETTHTAHPHVADEADEARQRYLESRPGPHS
jgi:hypothetical protein